MKQVCSCMGLFTDGTPTTGVKCDLAPPQGVGQDSVVGIPTRYRLDIRGSNPDEGEIFRTRLDWPSGPPSLLYDSGFLTRGKNGLLVSVTTTRTSSADIRERVEPYLYSPSGTSCSILGRTLPLPRQGKVKFSRYIPSRPLGTRKVKASEFSRHSAL